MGNYHPILMKIGTQIKKHMLSSKITEAEAYGKKQQKLNVKKRYRFKRQRCMSAKL
jgi:3-methyladenine DNA glycosylase Mpg